MEKVGIIILAAGASTRMGKAKQLLTDQSGVPLLNRLIDEVKKVQSNFVVVLGANAESIAETVKYAGATTVYNEDWREGMASSIRRGLSQLRSQDKDVSAALILVCDQPFVSASLISLIMQTRVQSGKPIVACSYQETIGVPALFERTFFDSLMALRGNMGAKNIISENMYAVAVIDFPQGKVDLDTPEDYDQFCNAKSQADQDDTR